MLRPRTTAALRAARDAGIHVVIATGRMYRSVRPYAEAAGIDGAARLLPGRRRRRPRHGRVAPARADPARARPRGDRRRRGRGLRAQLLRRRRPLRRRDHRARPLLRRLPEHPAARGRRPARLDRAAADEARRRRRSRRGSTRSGPGSEQRFGERLYIAKSLPYFLELASPAISKGSGLAFVAEHVGFTAERTVAFGDGENDLELLDWAGLRDRGRERGRQASRPAPTGSAPRPRRRASPR